MRGDSSATLAESIVISDGKTNLINPSIKDKEFYNIKQLSSLFSKEKKENFLNVFRRFLQTSYQITLNSGRVERVYGVGVDKYDDIVTELKTTFSDWADSKIAAVLRSTIKPYDHLSIDEQAQLKRLSHRQRLLLNQVSLLLFVVEPSRRR